MISTTKLHKLDFTHLSCMFSLNFRETNTYMKIDKNCTTNKNIDKIIAYLS